MNRRAKIVLAAAAVAVAGLATVRTLPASAHLGLGSNSEFAATLAQKLGISEDKTQEALESIRTDQQTQMQARYEEMLSQLVTEGKITEAQKQLILDKQKELTARREKERQELEAWAETNGIDLQYLVPGGHRMGQMGMGMGHGW